MVLDAPTVAACGDRSDRYAPEFRGIHRPIPYALNSCPVRPSSSLGSARLRLLLSFLAVAMAALSFPCRSQTAAMPVPPITSAKPASPDMLVTRFCTVPRELVHFTQPLPVLSHDIATKSEVNIVALGSSSTAGSGASSPDASYPARLQVDLEQRFPGRDFIVANYGTGGQSAADMLERMPGVIEHPPSLVLWQTGVNDAINNVGVSQFRETLNRGIRMLKTAGIDVVLIDMQFYPRSERVAGYDDYLRAMRMAADEHQIPLFRRFAVMKHVVKSGQHSPNQLLAPDSFHPNDLSYGCLADLITEGLVEQIRAGRTNASRLELR
jgi:acyl-CoA thioesterase-1